MEKRDYDFNLRTFPPPEIDAALLKKKQDELIRLSREKHARPRREVEAELARSEVWSLESSKTSSKREKKTSKNKSKAEKKIVPTKGNKSPPNPDRSIPPVSVRLDESEIQGMSGNGGTVHKYMQAIFKKVGEEHGYKAVVEKTLPDGSGSIDVVLEKGDKKIAIEVSVTTPGNHELGNIKKCLEAGYERVILCSTNNRTLSKVKALVEMNLGEADQEKVLLLRPEELIIHLQEESIGQEKNEHRVKGYKVKVLYQPVQEEQKKNVEESISSDPAILQGNDKEE